MTNSTKPENKCKCEVYDGAAICNGSFLREKFILESHFGSILKEKFILESHLTSLQNQTEQLMEAAENLLKLCIPSGRYHTYEGSSLEAVIKLKEAIAALKTGKK